MTDNGRIIECESGQLMYSIEEDEIVLEHLFVNPERRCQGTGGKLVKALIDKAFEIEKPITGYVYPEDDKTDYDMLKEFYEKLGFEIDTDDMLLFDRI